MRMRALKPLECSNDYLLRDGFPSAWILVDGLSVYVHRDGNALRVEILRTGSECSLPLAWCHAKLDPTHTEEKKHG